MKRFLPVSVIAAAVVGAAFYFKSHGNSNGNHSLTFTGNIELTEVHLAFKRPDRLVARYFDEGDFVTSGAIVARLDTAELENRRDEARAAVAVAESQLYLLDYEIRFQEESLNATIALRKAELEQAQALLKEAQTGFREQEIKQVEAAFERAKSEWEEARRDWDRIRGLWESGVVPQSQRDAAKTRYDAAAAALEQARQRLDLFREGTRKERIEAAKAAVSRARAALRVAEAGKIELERKQRERPIREAQLEKARAALALVETQIAQSVLIAPVSGVVLSKSAEPGEVLAAGIPVLTLGDLDHPWVRAYISETDLGRVHLGDPVRVRCDSFPGKVYKGKVTFISSEAEFTPKQIETREERTRLVYRIKVEVENPNHELKLNMPVEGEILTRGSERR